MQIKQGKRTVVIKKFA